jgi:predicted Zn-dependent peptidase
MAGSLAPPATADLEPLLEAANNAFGGTFSARLNMNLREDKHWTYGASAFVYGARGQRPYLAVTAVQTDKTAETVEEILKEFRGIIGTRPITDDELARIKDQTILELAGSRETMNAIGGAIADLVEFNFPDNYWDTYPEQVAAITPAAINAVAKNLIRPDAFIWVIVGDRSQIEKPLTALSLGEIVYLDATESVSAMSLL